jgi:hypothetical protein
MITPRIPPEELFLLRESRSHSRQGKDLHMSGDKTPIDMEAANNNDDRQADAPVSPKKRRMLIGCGAAIIGILGVLIAIAAILFLYKDRFADMTRQSMVKQYSTNFEKAKDAGTLSDENANIFFDLMVSIQQKETSITAASYACILLDRYLKAPDDKSREMAQAAATDLRELLANTPNANIHEVEAIMEKYPSLDIRNWNKKKNSSTL